VPLRTGTGGPTLVCLPAVGGGVADFAELAAALPPAWSVVAIPVLDARPAAAGIGATGSACAGAIAAALPDGPIHLLGWSYGAHVAFEAARRLRAAGRTIGALALVDAPAAGDLHAAPAAVPADVALPADLAPEDAARWLAGVAARRDAVARYRPQPWDGPAVLIRGSESVAGRARDATLGWSTLVRGRLDLEWAPGSHESLLSGDGARAVASIVERHAAAVTGREIP
jgi:thioesterase domain-containing protein